MQFLKNMVISVDNCGLIHKKGLKKYSPKNPFLKYNINILYKIYLCTIYFLENMFISMYNCVLIHKKRLKISPKIIFL